MHQARCSPRLSPPSANRTFILFKLFRDEALHSLSVKSYQSIPGISCPRKFFQPLKPAGIKFQFSLNFTEVFLSLSGRGGMGI